MLRQAARHDEHEVALAAPLRKAGRDALALVMSRAQQAGKGAGTPLVGQSQASQTLASPPPVMTLGTAEAAGTEGVVEPGTGQAVASTLSAPGVPFTRVAARDVARLVERICEEADENPDAEFEIAWRIVES